MCSWQIALVTATHTVVLRHPAAITNERPNIFTWNGPAKQDRSPHFQFPVLRFWFQVRLTGRHPACASLASRVLQVPSGSDAYADYLPLFSS